MIDLCFAKSNNPISYRRNVCEEVSKNRIAYLLKCSSEPYKQENCDIMSCFAVTNCCECIKNIYIINDVASVIYHIDIIFDI